ncbi:hypothetical protein SASPL_108729 [Salvia splendens]|uniref:DUF8040 domain-containing protein n=1 Tax=Salvia splendens TaxID=180675 RepID=A0A8X8YH84_SALSN|nr:hypothetical protein SASPL_108729 [Salvia splendens]
MSCRRRISDDGDETTMVTNIMSRMPELIRHVDRLLCWILRERMGLVDQKYVTIEEQVSMLLSLLAHTKRIGLLVTNIMSRMLEQIRHVDRLVRLTDIDCVNNLRTDCNCFGRWILHECMGLVDQKYVTVEEQVFMLLNLLAHLKKNRVVGFNFMRFGQSVSRYIHEVLRGMIGLHEVFMAKPTPVDDGCNDPHWKWFKVVSTTMLLNIFATNAYVN